MGGSSSRGSQYPMSGYPGTGSGYRNVGYEIQPYDYSRWGYIILYLIILLGSILLNGMFLLVVKKNQHLRRTAHYMFAALAIRDLIVTVAVVPFVIDSQAVNLMRWNGGDVLCKLFSFLNTSTMAAHSFLLVFTLLFLYFWYRKQEAYVTEDGQMVIRKNQLHKWAIPLSWVLALGLAIPAGALSVAVYNTTINTETCSVWDGRGNSGSGYWVMLSTIIVGFVVPAVVLMFPFIALFMQLCGAREPRLDPPHSRTAATGVALFMVFVGTRGPYEVYTLMKLFHQSNIGLKANTWTGTPYAVTGFETDVVINALSYLACLLNPIVYFAVNPDYRKGLAVVWRHLYCNKDPVQRERDEAEKRLRKQQQAQQQPMQPAPPKRQKFPGSRNNRAPPHLRQNQEQLLHQQQRGMIVGAQQQQQQHGYMQQYPQQQQQFQYPQQQPQQFAQQYQYPQMQQQQYYPGQQPMMMLRPDQQFLDNSFERLSPQLPPVFEYDGLKYIDTARVEPRIGYSPEKTPPKTPETPHYTVKPFQIPIVANQPKWSPPIEMMDLSPQGPIATSEPKRQNFKMEELDDSPGSTLRTRRHKDDTIEVLDDSPRSKSRRKMQEQSQSSSGYYSTNGTGVSTSRPTSPQERPSSRASGVEIVITGRTRSRTDLCPDVPRSKFEHTV